MNKFQESALSVPREHRCIQSSPGNWNLPLDYCFFGVPQSESYGWTVLESIPENTNGIHFYLGGDCEELVEAFAGSKFPQSIARLAIGNSSYSIGKKLDYSALIEKIGGIEFPRIKILELGVWELFSNSHCMFGELGDVTSVLENCPQLEWLGLYGSFGLNASIEFTSLKEITATLEDSTTGSNGGFITQATLCNLLASNFPNLEEAFIDLICEDDEFGYRFPEAFLEGKNMPNLKKMEITGGFKPGEKERLLASPLCDRAGVIFHLDDMLES